MPLQVRRSTSLVPLLKAQHSFLLRLHCNRAEFFSSVLSVPPTSHSLKHAENCRLPIGLAHRLLGSTVDSDASLMWACLTGIPHYSQEQLRLGVGGTENRLWMFPKLLAQHICYFSDIHSLWNLLVVYILKWESPATDTGARQLPHCGGFEQHLQSFKTTTCTHYQFSTKVFLVIKNEVVLQFNQYKLGSTCVHCSSFK